MRFIKVGDIFAGMNPVEATETVTSGTVFVVPTSGQINTMSTGGAALVIVDSTVSPGATEVSIAYTDGVPTATFGAAVATYTYTQSQTSAQLGSHLSAEAYIEP